MAIRRLRLQNFRSIEFAELDLCDGFNCFLGANGAGKTTVLESLYLLGRGRSFRSSSIDVLINHEAASLSASVDLETLSGFDSVLLNKPRRQPLSLKINGHHTQRLSDAASKLPLQLLTPEVSDLVLAGPVERRQYLDWGLFHVEHRYHVVARDYSRALKQRNTWLHDLPRARNQLIDPWAEVLQDLASELDAFRSAYCSEIFELIVDTAQSLDVGLPLEFFYFKGWKEVEGRTLADLLQESIVGDVKLGSTKVGPHRADIQVKTRGQAASDVLSRGQAKLLAVAMKVAQVELLRRKTGNQSTVLFDELIAELDYQRANKVLEKLRRLECQVIVSSVELPDAIKKTIENRSRLFHVKQGAITALEE